MGSRILLNVSSLNESIRTNLQSDIDLYFRWLLLCTVLVAVGVILEEFDLFSTNRYRIDPLTGIPRVCFGIKRWLHRLTILGWFLVVIGVAGEGAFEYCVSAYDGHLRTFNDILALSANKEVALARQEAESASITAKGFESQIEESKARVKTAEAQIASANAASKDAVAKVAAADARIAEANRAAQEAQKETVRLEAQIQPRRLTTAQQNILSFRCAHFIGKKVAVETYSLDVESVILARQIMSALRNIGIVVEDNSMSIIPARGLSLGIHVYGRDKGLVNVLVIAFRSLNLAAVANASPPNEAIMRSGGNGDAAVTILVGVKPPPAE